MRAKEKIVTICSISATFWITLWWLKLRSFCISSGGLFVCHISLSGAGKFRFRTRLANKQLLSCLQLADGDGDRNSLWLPGGCDDYRTIAIQRLYSTRYYSSPITVLHIPFNFFESYRVKFRLTRVINLRQRSEANDLHTRRNQCLEGT